MPPRAAPGRLCEFVIAVCIIVDAGFLLIELCRGHVLISRSVMTVLTGMLTLEHFFSFGFALTLFWVGMDFLYAHFRVTVDVLMRKKKH